MAALLPTLLWLCGMGCLCGLALALAAKYFAVKEDPRVAEIEDSLSGANCGACGYAGCQAYAAAVARGEAPVDGCVPGGAAAAMAVAKIMGVEFSGAAEPKVAFVKCGGDCDSATRRFAYNGIADCAAAAAVAGGDKGCPHGCLGYGSCANACPSHAITVEKGIARVNEALCVGCGLCAKTCPRHVIEMVPRSAKVRVFCNSTDNGSAVRKYCKRGCIGCRMCARNSAEGVMQIDGFLARVNYSVPFDGDAAIEKCPAKCLRRVAE